MAVAYGIKVTPENDPFIETAELANSTLLEAAVPGKFLVDAIPTLKYLPEWFPGATFKKKAREWKAATEAMVEMPWNAFLKAAVGNYLSLSLF